MHRIGIDLGGTKIEIAVLDDQGRAVFRKRVPTRQEEGYRAILNRIEALYREALAAAGHQPHTLGVGTPGAVSAKTGLMKNSNTQCLNGRPLPEDLAAQLSHPLRIENDANCFTLAEALLGAGAGKEMVFGVIMGTGCGGGIAIGGRIHSGIQRIAGEWGHMTIDPAGPACYCGKRGCVETLISGGGLQRIYEERSGAKRPVEAIVAGFRSGEPGPAEVFLEFLEHFGVALANVIGILDPDLVVLGGGLSNIAELYTLGREEVRKHLFSDELLTPIVPNRLGDSAGVFGAAMAGV
jgi:fructokinase